MASVPKIFISSTYFDLREVREHLGNTIEAMGFEPIRSEVNSFPIDPTVDTIENCRRTVEREADVLILIIGGRYGFVREDLRKSVTNIEYLAARSKGIPIYAFVDRKVLDLVPIYDANPTADFTSAVDNPALFRFIKQVRQEHSIWTYPFDFAHEISETLRTQFAQRLGEALRVISLIESVDQKWMRRLSPDAFRIAAEQPSGWEYLLFSQALTDAVESHRELRLRNRFGIAYGPTPVNEPIEIPDFIVKAMNESLQLVASFDVLMHKALPEALGAPGETGDAQMLTFVAREIGEIYRQTLVWAERVRSARGVEGASELVENVAAFADCIIIPIEEFGPYTLGEVRRGLLEGTAERPVTLSLVLTLGELPLEKHRSLLLQFASNLGVQFQHKVHNHSHNG